MDFLTTLCLMVMVIVFLAIGSSRKNNSREPEPMPTHSTTLPVTSHMLSIPPAARVLYSSCPAEQKTPNEYTFLWLIAFLCIYLTVDHRREYYHSNYTIIVLYHHFLGRILLSTDGTFFFEI